MAERSTDLALAFVQSRPQAAAAVLEQQPLEQVGDFLAGIPGQQAAAVLAKMLPGHAARLFRVFEGEISVELLCGMETARLAAILRHCSKDFARKLLDLLPDNTRIACRLLLNYSEEAVGAWMTTNVSCIPEDISVTEAIERFRFEPGTADTGSVYVIDRDSRLKGLLALSRMLRCTPDRPVNAIMDRVIDSIPARTALTSAEHHPAWSRTDYLPVVNRSQQFVGALRYADLRRGLEKTSVVTTPPLHSDPISGLYQVYGASLMALFDTVTDIARGNTSPS